jgi:hypothetical protein
VKCYVAASFLTTRYQPKAYQPQGQTLSDNSGNQFVITGSSNVVNINSEKNQEEKEAETD